MLVFTLPVSAYVAPRLVGGLTVKVMSVPIFEPGMVLLNLPLGTAMSFVLLLVVLLLFVGTLRLAGAADGVMRSGLAQRVTIGFIVAFLLAPIVVVTATSVTATAYPVFPPRGFTLRWFGQYLQSDTFMASTWLSLLAASCTAILVAILGTVAALGLDRAEPPGRNVWSST